MEWGLCLNVTLLCCDMDGFPHYAVLLNMVFMKEMKKGKGCDRYGLHYDMAHYSAKDNNES